MNECVTRTNVTLLGLPEPELLGDGDDDGKGYGESDGVTDGDTDGVTEVGVHDGFGWKLLASSSNEER